MEDNQPLISQLRLARKLAKNQRKRRHTKRAEARREAETRAQAEELAVAAALRARRQHEGDEAVTQLERRRQQQGFITSEHYEQAVDAAKVRLVQRHHEREGEHEERGDDESAQYIEADDGLPTACMEVAGERRNVKLDSGARYTVAGTEWIALGDRVSDTAPVDCVEGIGGFLLDVVGVWRFELTNIFGEIVRVDACIINGCTDEFLLGVDFMREHGANMDFAKNEMKYESAGPVIVIPFRTFDGDNRGKVAAVRMAATRRLGRSTVTPIEVAVTAEDGEKGIFLPATKLGSVMLAATVTEARNGKTWVPAINAGRDRVKLPSKKELGTWILLDDDVTVLEVNGSMSRERIVEWLADMGDTETPVDNEHEMKIGVEDEDSRSLMKKLLRVYRNLVVDADDCPPATALDVEHHIDTGDAKPMMLKRRRHAQKENEVVHTNVQKMLSAGVIEEGNGAWGFPVVLVKKKDGEVRFCIDYRALNAVTRKDAYPLPRIDETLESLGGAVLFTTLDLRSGYWQIRVASADKEKTAFTTKRRLYQFKRMPFVLTNAPATFQRLMNSVLQGLTWPSCLVYLDDIVIYTRGGIERHVLEVACVLERLSAAGLTLKLKKCMFATQRMEYLGHELSVDGVRPLDRLVTAVREFPKPRDATEVKRFVHLAGYYRRFIEGFGAMMSPMTKLLRKDVEWEWGEAQDDAFERVKEALT
ncbi:hypothetical protein PF010_g8269 [Phytophthora fragariae]|uniref:Reverse transcriptase domain-containing protein n=2 Tax=Phytophthora fragariae TaxID=53985 RepID=A0A6G0LFY1_9STRA|nr:hypothetical protein PF010_g8269 [Phytophthora fragariae]KAE9244116.1 hypothetical protein PF004_g5813 [Phytophthora fragariae]